MATLTRLPTPLTSKVNARRKTKVHKAEYVELLCKSNFSFLTGASHPEELIDQAIAQGLKGCAITDVNGVYGLGRAFKRAKLNPEFKLIIGSEFSFLDQLPLVLLALNKKGYGRLCRLISLSHQGKAKGEAELRWQEFLDFASREACQDWIALPTLAKEENNFSRLGDLKNLFGPRLYLPLARYRDGFDRIRQETALRLSKRLGASVVATNDVYYHCKERKKLQDILISVREGKPLVDLGFDLFSNGERYIKSPRQMMNLFSDLPEAIHATLEIADQCMFSPRELRYRYPSEWIPQGMTAQSYLETLVYQQAPLIYKQGLAKATEKMLRHELDLIQQLGYADYFLTIFDIVQFARRRGILCQGRGSAANSVVCYVLGITAIDPIQMNLLFERFISAERNEPPDIDVDFEHERREEVIQYIYQKYGRDRAGMVSAVVTYRRRSAFREVCKAFGVPVGQLSARKVEREFFELTKTQKDPEKLFAEVSHFAHELQGFPRHLSIHSGGFTLSADPIIDIVPIEPARMEGRTIIQWDKYDLDELGLLKVDVLALGMLSAIRKTLDLVGLKLHEIPHDDPKTYAMIQRGDTVGVFQIESRAQISMLGRLRPQNFYDLVIEVAIMRPGPIVGKMVHPYLKRRRGLEKIHYPNKTVEQILGKTLGVPLFQEQVMRLAIELAGFSPGEADQLRRSINAWRTSRPMGDMAVKLMNGLLASGMPKSFADQIFEQIQGFSHYGFPESHAASFALLAYASSYLKCHYHAEFTCSLLNSQPLGFYRNDTLIYDAIRAGVRVLPVCIHKSQWDCTMENGAIRLGFRIVKGIAEKDVGDLIHERETLRFSSVLDFVKRSHLRKDVLERFALAGRLSSRNCNPRQVLWALLEYENLLENKTHKTCEQLSLFNEFFEPESEASEAQFSPLNDFEKIQQDYATFSLSMHGHPMGQLRSLKRVPKIHSRRLRSLPSGSQVSVAGLILVRQKPPTAKGVVFSTLEDEFGFVDLILHQKVYETHKEVFLNHCFIIAKGTLQRDSRTVSLLVNQVDPIFHDPEPPKAKKTSPLRASPVDSKPQNPHGFTPLTIEPTTYFHP